jgi:muconolactone delta-isomerase
MPYYLVSFTLSQNYFDAKPEEREALTKQEVAHGIKLFKIGIWKHAYTTPGDIKTESWALYETSNQAVLERYLAEYPMDKLNWYTRVINEVTIPDPPWIVGLGFKVLRSIGLYKPWMPI